MLLLPWFGEIKIYIYTYMTLLTTTSAFRLGRRRWSSPQQCYLHCLHTFNTIRYNTTQICIARKITREWEALPDSESIQQVSTSSHQSGKKHNISINITESFEHSIQTDRCWVWWRHQQALGHQMVDQGHSRRWWVAQGHEGLPGRLRLMWLPRPLTPRSHIAAHTIKEWRNKLSTNSVAHSQPWLLRLEVISTYEL